MFSSDNEIAHIARGMMNCTLPRAEWTHAAHFAAAVYLLRSPNHDAMLQMPDMIRAYNVSVGTINTDTDGYHDTITRASIRMAAYELQLMPDGLSLHDSMNRLMAGEAGNSDWILAYWSRETLFTPKARRHWVEPDMKPLPDQA